MHGPGRRGALRDDTALRVQEAANAADGEGGRDTSLRKSVGLAIAAGLASDRQGVVDVDDPGNAAGDHESALRVDRVGDLSL